MMTRSRVGPWKLVRAREDITSVKLLRGPGVQSCMWVQTSFWMRENLEWGGQCESGAGFSTDRGSRSCQVGDNRLWEAQGLTLLVWTEGANNTGDQRSGRDL